MIKVYYVPSCKITREYLMIKQGLVNNPRVELVQWGEGADFVFLFYTVLKHRPDFAKTFFPSNKTIFIDYHDKPDMVFDVDCLAYFKRSWVKGIRSDLKQHITLPDRHYPFYPLTFAIMDEFIIDEDIERDYTLSCTIRPHMRHPNRPRVLEYVRGIPMWQTRQVGELNQGNMKRFNDPDMRDYFRLLKRSRIVVTCNPSRWEGDFRTWEAFANGALVFVDRMFTPMAHPLIDGKHCIFYEVSDSGLKELRGKILYFLKNTIHAQTIASTGFDFTMKHHRASNRIDEILEIII